MEITSVNLKAVKNECPVVAYVSIVFDEVFCVRKIRVLERNGEFTVCMPSMRTKENKYTDVCHPINQDFRKKVVVAILNAYRGQLESEAL